LLKKLNWKSKSIKTKSKNICEVLILKLISNSVKEMMFSKQEVTDIMEGIKEKITFQMDKEISYYLNMNGNLNKNFK
jgi:hypothetical protein